MHTVCIIDSVFYPESVLSTYLFNSFNLSQACLLSPVYMTSVALLLPAELFPLNKLTNQSKHYLYHPHRQHMVISSMG